MQYSKILLPGFDKPIRSFQPDTNASSLEEYLAKFIMSKVIFTLNQNSQRSKSNIQSFDLSFIEGAARGEQPYKDFWDNYVKGFLQKHGKKTDPKDYLQTYRVYATNFPRSIRDFKDFIFYPPKDNLKDTPEIKALVRKVEANDAQFTNFDGEIKSYPKSKLKIIINDLEKEIEESDDEDVKDNLQKQLQNLIKANSSTRGIGFKKDIILRLAIEDLEDIDGTNMPELSLYTMLVNIPQNEELTPDNIKNEYLGEDEYYPTGKIGEGMSRLVEQFLSIADKRGKDLKVEIPRGRRFTNVDTPERVYRVNSRPPSEEENTLLKAIDKYEQQISAEEYVRFLKNPKSSEDLQLDATPEDLKKIQFGGDEPAVLEQSIFEKNTNQRAIQDDEDTFKSAIQSADNNSKQNIDRNDLDVLYKAIPQEAQINKIYIDGNVAEAIRNQSVQGLRKYFYADRNGRIRMRVHNRGTKFRGYGLRYEHVVPMKVLGGLAIELYSMMKQSGKFDDKEFKKRAEEIITSLYTIAWVDISKVDVKLDRSNLTDRMGKGWEVEFKKRILDGELSRADQTWVRDSIWKRYRTAGIDVDKFVPLRDLFSGGSIKLDKVTKQQLALKVDDDEQPTLREDNISLFELINSNH